jgi:hypothetical protein
MADQSSIQTVLQKLAGTASAGQANLPSSINNGNPNTIYNQKPPQGGYLPPVTNGFDQWRINPMPQSQTAPVNWQSLAANAPGNNLSSMLPKWPTTVPVVNVPGWGGTTPPPVVPGTTPLPPPGTPVVPGTGGNLGNHPGGGGVGGGGGGGLNTGSGRGLRELDLVPGSIGLFDKQTTGTELSKTLDDSVGWGDLAQGDIQGILGTSLNLGQAGSSLANSALGRSLGIKADGTLSIGEILDWVIPGNIYMSQTGKLNLLSAIPGLLSKLNPVLGMAAGAAMKWLAEHTNIKALKNWLQRIKDNKAAGRGGNGDFGVGSPGGPGSMLGGGSFMGGSEGWGGTDMRDVTITAGGSGSGVIGGIGSSGGSGTLGGILTDQE